MPLVWLEYLAGVLPLSTMIHISCHKTLWSVTVVDLVHVEPDEVGFLIMMIEDLHEQEHFHSVFLKLVQWTLTAEEVTKVTIPNSLKRRGGYNACSKTFFKICSRVSLIIIIHSQRMWLPVDTAVRITLQYLTKSYIIQVLDQPWTLVYCEYICPLTSIFTSYSIPFIYICTCILVQLNNLIHIPEKWNNHLSWGIEGMCGKTCHTKNLQGTEV